jgi:hypothetical protein
MRKREILDKMTKSELCQKLEEAQSLLSDVYAWASEVQESKLAKNEDVARAMSVADGCIYDALQYLDWYE